MNLRIAAVLAAATCSLLLAAPAAAAIVHDGRDAGGPLDLASVKVGQHEQHLLVRVKTASHPPRLKALGGHPPIERDKPQRYLCVGLASPAIGREILCPSGRVKHGRIDVGVSAVVHHRSKPKGSIPARVDRGGRSIALELGLGRFGLKPGRLTFAGQSSWYGPGCKRGAAGGREGAPEQCRDRAPQRGSGKARIYPVQRVGCSGFSENKVFNGSRSRKRVALTFDDGPSTYTPQILSILNRFHVHATFFEIGEQVPSYPGYVRQVLAQGSELANHSLHHESGPGTGSLRSTSSLIRRASGFDPCMFRPPGGYLPGSTLAAAQSLDMVSVLWDVDTRDWTLPGSGAIYQRATAVQPGSIVLMHDGGGPRSQTVAAVPEIIRNLKSRGYKLVTMTQLLGGHYRYAEVHHRHHRPLPDPQPFPRRREGP